MSWAISKVREIAILRRSVPRSVFAVRLLSAFIYFLTRSDLKSEISNLRSQIDLACVAEQQRPPPSKSGVQRLRRCESYYRHQDFLGRRITGKPSDSKPEILGSNPGVPAKSQSKHFS